MSPARPSILRSAVRPAAWVLGGCALLYPLAIAWFGDAGQWLDAGSPLGVSTDLRMNLVMGVLIVFTAAASTAESDATLVDLERLAPSLRLDAGELERLRDRASSDSRSRSQRVLISMGGALFGASIDLAADGFAASPIGRSPHDAAQFLLIMVLFALLASRARDSLRLGRLFSEIGREHTEVSLFDTEPLQVFGRRGLRLSLNWFLGSAFASLLALDASAPGIVAGVIVLTLGLGAASLLIPARGIHAAIRDAKHAELARIRTDLEKEGAALLAPDARDAAGSRVPALVAYESRVSAVREWPFDASTLVRFTVLAAIATGSWLGGAIVERILEMWVP